MKKMLSSFTNPIDKQDIVWYHKQYHDLDRDMLIKCSTFVRWMMVS